MALTIAGFAIAAPAQPVEAAAVIFDQLGKQFAWHESLAKHLVEVKKLETLEDFAFALTSEAEAKPLVDGIRECPEDLRMVMAGRVRRAWGGVRKALDEATAAKGKDATNDVDLDKVLGKEESDNLEDTFWSRHKMCYPPQQGPADALKSRLYREIARRMTTVRDIWGVRTLGHQMRASKRREEITAKLFLVGEGEDTEVSYDQSTEQYLRNLKVLMVAYAKAGAVAVPDAPPGPEQRGADTTKYVQVPLDVMMRYLARAETQAAKVDIGERLAWLSARDEAERAAWVEMHRSSNHSFGTVVKTLYEQREAMWVVKPVEQAKRKLGETDFGAYPDRRPNTRVVVGDGLVMNMRDGRKICLKWNKGSCSKKCPDRALHVCCQGFKGRACASPDHRACVGSGCPRVG